MTTSATVTKGAFVSEQKIAVQRSQWWEIVGFFAMLAALLLALLVDREWGVFALLFAIYCAAMR
jgi:hypothetical protein